MPAKQLDDLFDLGADVLGTKQNEQGTILAQTGDVVGEDVFSDDAEVWGPVGYAARPPKAIAGKSAAQAIAIKQGTNDVLVAFRDLRGSKLYGTLEEGEVCVYAPGPDNTGTAKIKLAKDGTVTITAGGATITIAGDGVTVDAPQASLCGGADFAALAAKVDANFSALVAAIQAAQSPAGTTGGPLVFTPPPLPSVAAAKVKVT